MADNLPEHFVDMVTTVSFSNGVFRMTLAQHPERRNGQPVPVARLMIPASQMAPILRHLTGAAADINKQAQSRASAAKGAAAEKVDKKKDK